MKAPGLTAEMRLPDGTMATVDHDVLEIGRRINEGDELWRGDPTMVLGWDWINERFVVYGLDAEGEPYLAASSETCDHRLLEKLVEGDWQRGKEAALAVALHERDLRAERERQAADRRGEVIEQLGWAIRKDLGTRNFHGQVGKGLR